ncbi:MAG: beta-lactamase family protein [Proteobacteria bacterium]|nr:beta-lactamase family protein [Pseudomonadota bacterium]
MHKYFPVVRFPLRWFALALVLAVTFTLGACGSLSGNSNNSSSIESTYPHANEPIGTVRQVYDGALTPDMAVNTFRNIDRLFPTRAVKTGGTPYPLPRAATQLDQIRFTSNNRNYDLFDYLALNRVTALLILKDGKIVNETYQEGNTERTHWMSMSIAKSITSTLIGAAVKDGYIGSINDPVTKYVPRLAGSAYDGVTVRQIMMMASGVKWDETYTDPKSDRRALLEAQISQKPGAAMNLMASLPRAHERGAVNNYSTGETQVAGEIVFGATKKPLAAYLSEKIWSRFAMEAEANWWLDSPGGVEIGGSGFSATLRDYGRFGMFIMNNGAIGNERILPEGWVDEAGSPKTLTTGETMNYGYLWWAPGNASPSHTDGAFYATGIFGQNIYINRKEKVVIVTWGAQSKPSGAAVINNMDFFDAVVAKLKTSTP